MQAVLQDVRYGIRMLARTPALTLIIAVTLGLGIGANAAIFSVVDLFMFRPLQVPHPEDLVVLGNSHPGNDRPHEISYLDFQDYRKGSTAFSDLAAYDLGFVGLSSGERTDRVMVSYVTGNYFEMLGVQPYLGRLIETGEGDAPGKDPILVLGYDYWRRRFNSDPAVIGTTVRVAGSPVTIIGVTPPSFQGTYSIVDMDGFLPLGMNAMLPDSKDLFVKRDSHSLRVIGRLKRGTSLRQAAASLEVVARQIEAAHPDTNRAMKMHVFPERLARPEPSSAQENPVLAAVFLVLVGVVLLVACVNVANILLARAAARQKELAIRAAMGAGRGRLVRQMLTESGMLALLGIAAGAVFARLANVALERVRMPGGIPFRIDLSFDWLTFAFLAGSGLTAGILVGVVPALRASRADLNETLREGGRGNSGGVEHHRVRNILVVSQVMGSMVLLIAAGLFIRSLNSAQKAELGFRPDHTLNLTIDTAQAGLDRTRSNEFFRELETRVRAVPGVESATVAYSVPFGYYNSAARVLAEGQPLPEDPRGLFAGCNYVGTDYLRTIGTPLLRGREIRANDTETSPRVAVINELMAKKLWPGQDALGKRFSVDGPKGPFIEVVGITPLAKYQYLFEDPSPYFFAPLTQNYQAQRVLQVRTVGPPSELSLPLERVVREIQPNLPVYNPNTMEEQLQGGNGLFLVKMGAIFAGALGGLGLLLAVVGVYGVVSYSAAQRTHEIGVRMALGAQRMDILRMVLRQGVALVGIGVVIGTGVALALGRFLANFLFGIRAYDPVTYAAVSLLLVTVAVVACVIPAQRATRVDPLVALRYE